MKLRTLIIMALMCASTGVHGGDFPEMEPALEFLYKYMPVPDRIMYPDSFWRANVEVTLKARSEIVQGSGTYRRRDAALCRP